MHFQNNVIWIYWVNGEANDYVISINIFLPIFILTVVDGEKLDTRFSGSVNSLSI